MKTVEQLQDSYDFVVIGAGPGGLLACLNLLKPNPQDPDKKYTVALVDRKDPWEEPVACAEAVNKSVLESLVPKVEPNWIREEVDGVIFVAPNGEQITYQKKKSGYLIDRSLMHKNLAEWCAEAGADCHFRTRVKSISSYNEEEQYREVEYDGETSGTIRARVVIDASGPGAGFCKEENIVQGDFDLEPAIFALVKGPKFPVNYIQMFFGKNYAPGGYAWLFPRDENVANVGLVVGKEYTREAPPRKSLMEFLEREYPGCEVDIIKGGGISCGHTSEPFATKNLFKVGDAANMVNPISRAGILEAMRGGEYAAEAALEVIELKNEMYKQPHYDLYKERWDKAFGNNHLRIHKAKKEFGYISDKTFNRAAKKILRIPEEKRSMKKIFMAVLLTNPLVLWRMRSLIGK